MARIPFHDADVVDVDPCISAIGPTLIATRRFMNCLFSSNGITGRSTPVYFRSSDNRRGIYFYEEDPRILMLLPRVIRLQVVLTVATRLSLNLNGHFRAATSTTLPPFVILCRTTTCFRGRCALFEESVDRKAIVNLTGRFYSTGRS